MKTLLLCMGIAIGSAVHAQPWLQQYFDGEDTLSSNSIFFYPDTLQTDVWQIGPPQKLVFDAPYSAPNVLVTDTVATVPDSTNSSFYFGVSGSEFAGSILALQWMQKLDMEDWREVGSIEYSRDTGLTWFNVFDDPEGVVYNFYGFDDGLNMGYHPISGDAGFTGSSEWNDIWLCFDYSFVDWGDSIVFKYTIQTDTIDHNRDGWMIDNFQVHPTWFHTIVENSRENVFTAFPTTTDGRLNVVFNAKADKPNITSVELIDLKGRVVDYFEPDDLNFILDLSDHRDGRYTLKIITDVGFDTCPVIVKH